MARSKSPASDIYSIPKLIKGKVDLPVYFLTGEDTYAINKALKILDDYLSSMVQSEMDREVISLDKKTKMTELLPLLTSYPFSGGKKLIILKNFNYVDNKTELANYIKDPMPLTSFVIVNYGKVSSYSSEPYKSLLANNYLFEAGIPEASTLIRWIVQETERKGKKISQQDAALIVEFVGEDKYLLDMQIQKIADYLGEDNQIVTEEIIKKVSSAWKGYGIFDLTNAIGSGDKKKAYIVALTLLDSGFDVMGIIGMLSKVVIVIAQSMEVVKMPEVLDSNYGKINNFKAASIIGVNPFFFQNCLKAKHLMNREAIVRACEALLNAEIAVKTSALDEKTLVSLLIEQLLVKK